MAFRDGPFENFKVPLTWTAALAVLAAAGGAAFLLISDNREDMTSDGYGGVREGFDSITAPISSVFAAPVRWTGQGSDWIVGYFNAVEENRRLKEELKRMQAVQDANIALKNLNRRYEALLQIRTEPAIQMATARAVAESRGPFVNARLIDAGTRKGIRVGNPVINEHGLVGRVVGTTTGVSRVLLLSDVASRTPVLIDRTDARAILVGDGGPNPRLEFVRGTDSVKPGDRILTSGDGGVFPRGLPVGEAARGVGGGWRVKLYADRGDVDFVRVLLFQNFDQLVDPRALNAPPLAALQAAPPPSPELAARIEAVAPARRGSEPAPVPVRPVTPAPGTTAPRPGATPPPRPASTAAAAAPRTATPPAAAPTKKATPPAAAPTKKATPPAPAPKKKASPPARRPDGTPSRPVPYNRLNPGGVP